MMIYIYIEAIDTVSMEKKLICYSTNDLSPAFRFGWCRGCQGRCLVWKGMDPTDFQELTKLQTPKAPAVGIVQHTGQPPGKSET